MRAVALALALILAGCVGASATPPPKPTPMARSDGGSAGATSRDALPKNVTAPVLPVGRAWTYEGAEFYNEDTKFDVVVARADEKGYLFAAGAEDDLVYNALWGGPWLGERSLSLDSSVVKWHLLDFPLADGKTWTVADGLVATARAADVATPRGTEPGFVIEGKSDRGGSLRAEYAPSIGNVVKYDETWSNGVVGEAWRMTAVKDNAKWVWYELGTPASAGGPDQPAKLDVPAGYDAVIASAGGTQGGRTMLEGPGGAQWSYDFQGAESWHQATLPATPGSWAGAAAGHPFVPQAPTLPAEWPVGWSYLTFAPVKWVRSR